VSNFNLFDHERFVIAEATLVVAVHDEVQGSATAAQRTFITHARSILGDDYVDALHASATGAPPPSLPTIEEWRLHDFAGFAPLGDFTAVSNYTDVLLPADPRGLW
jgi:hypothetical protein